jgi:hypothetical protein
LQLPATATDGDIATALRGQATELESMRNRCARLAESQADADLERFAEVITNRDVVRAQLLANRDGTMAVLEALRRPEPVAPLHQPRLPRPNLALLSPLAPEPDPATARRVVRRRRRAWRETHDHDAPAAPPHAGLDPRAARPRAKRAHPETIPASGQTRRKNPLQHPAIHRPG